MNDDFARQARSSTERLIALSPDSMAALLSAVEAAERAFDQLVSDGRTPMETASVVNGAVLAPLMARIADAASDPRGES